AEVLRDRLASRWRTGADRERLEQARSVMEKVHRDLSPALALEERVAWGVAASELDQVERELGRAVTAFTSAHRPGIAAWAAQAWQRLPAVARVTTAGSELYQIARTAASATVSLSRDIAGRGERGLTESLRGIANVKLGVLRVGATMELGNVGTEGSVAILVPDTNPRLVDVMWSDNDGRERREALAIYVGDRKTLDVGGGPVRLQTATGVVFEIGAQQARAERRHMAADD